MNSRDPAPAVPGERGHLTRRAGAHVEETRRGRAGALPTGRARRGRRPDCRLQAEFPEARPRLVPALMARALHGSGSVHRGQGREAAENGQSRQGRTAAAFLSRRSKDHKDGPPNAARVCREEAGGA